MSLPPSLAAVDAALDRAPVMLWRGTPEGVAFVNRAWAAFRGRPATVEIGQGWLDGVFAEDRERVDATFSAACKKRRAFEVDYRLRRADNVWRWVRLNGTPLPRAGRAFPGHIGSCIDITEHREGVSAEDSPLRRLESLIGNARDMAYCLRLVPERVMEYATGAVEAITGHTAEEFYADPTLPQRAIHPDDLQTALQNVDEPDRLSLSDIVIRWVHPDGRIVWAEHRRRPMFDPSGRVIGIEGVARDITGLIESQRRLRDSEDQMRLLAGRLQAAREEERTKVARELHDELGQILTALKLEIGRAIAALEPKHLTPTVIDRMQSLVGLSEIGIATVKRIATDLRPPALDHLGLTEAIRWEALAFKARSGLRCHVRANGRVTTSLSREQQTAVFRIFQEALTNVARHARASAVTVTISERQHFELSIKDNGKGISDSQAADPRAIGLIGMRERAALVGGTFHIAGHRGKGTTVSVHLPLMPAPKGTPAPRTRLRKTRQPRR
jgi:PAS domain S-box-containing protein